MDCPNNRTSTTAGLPDDIFMEILSRVFPLDLPRFKCVSKAWRRLIDDLLHCKEHPRTLRGFLFMDEQIWDEATRGSGGGAHGGLRGFVDLLPSVPLNIDPTFNFLTKMPWIDSLSVKATCNGLLLVQNTDAETLDVRSYVVCNPATGQWEAVPGFPNSDTSLSYTYLVFDPAVSSNFNLVRFLLEMVNMEEEVLSVHTTLLKLERGVATT
ncbi:hypothetical protein QOZ80_4AG0300490 [Eleusine coracana subsp. coracana]|nr:hypothetical protein QOZ80_4AG0300490 [Eleusine coracana subsp. coracana]